jgi:hypothetical protein
MRGDRAAAAAVVAAAVAVAVVVPAAIPDLVANPKMGIWSRKLFSSTAPLKW